MTNYQYTIALMVFLIAYTCVLVRCALVSGVDRAQSMANTMEQHFRGAFELSAKKGKTFEVDKLSDVFLGSHYHRSWRFS